MAIPGVRDALLSSLAVSVMPPELAVVSVPEGSLLWRDGTFCTRWFVEKGCVIAPGTGKASYNPVMPSAARKAEGIVTELSGAIKRRP